MEREIITTMVTDQNRRVDFIIIKHGRRYMPQVEIDGTCVNKAWRPEKTRTDAVARLVRMAWGEGQAHAS